MRAASWQSSEYKYLPGRVRQLKARAIGVGKLGDFPGGIADKRAKKAVLADMRAFFSLSAGAEKSVIKQGENSQF